MVDGTFEYHGTVLNALLQEYLILLSPMAEPMVTIQ